MARRNSGRTWEAHCAHECIRLHKEGVATMTRMATHHHGGVPSLDPKVDFIGALHPNGRLVAFDCKSGTGVLTKQQRTFLTHLTRAGALAFVYHSDGYTQIVLENGDLGEKIKVTSWAEITRERVDG